MLNELKDRARENGMKIISDYVMDGPKCFLVSDGGTNVLVYEKLKDTLREHILFIEDMKKTLPLCYILNSESMINTLLNGNGIVELKFYSETDTLSWSIVESIGDFLFVEIGHKEEDKPIHKTYLEIPTSLDAIGKKLAFIVNKRRNLPGLNPLDVIGNVFSFLFSERSDVGIKINDNLASVHISGHKEIGIKKNEAGFWEDLNKK